MLFVGLHDLLGFFCSEAVVSVRVTVTCIGLRPISMDDGDPQHDNDDRQWPSGTERNGMENLTGRMTIARRSST